MAPPAGSPRSTPARRAGASRRRRAAPSSQRCEVNATGQPLKGSSPTARVRGFLDDHIHLGAFEFLGGRFHCGRPWSPYGVTVALKDCADHFPNGAGAVAENFLSTGSPVGTHSAEGWPSFAGWPRDESQTHEGTYWKWIERAWRGGLRLMVNDLVENRALCDIYPLKRTNCNEMVSAYKQIEDMRALQDYIDAQFGGPGKGFFRLVRSPPRRAGSSTTASSPSCSESRCPRCSTAGSSTARRSATRPRSTGSSTGSTPPASGRCSPCTSSTTRWAARGSTAGPRACWSTRGTSTPPASSGPPTTATTPITTTRPTRSATRRPSS